MSIINNTLHAQDSLDSHRASGNVSKAAINLKKSLSANDNELETAFAYEVLAKGLLDKGDYARAEDNLKKALEIYTRLKSPNAAAVSRQLAKVQESQQKIAPAIRNYEAAGQLSTDKALERANFNDASRLLNTNNPAVQSNYAQSNVVIFEKDGRKTEAADAYRQLGYSQLQTDNKADAIESYKKALNNSDNTRDIAAISKDLSKAYVADNNIMAAIHTNEAVLEKARQEHNIPLQINQVTALAQLYMDNRQPGKSGPLLEEAYQLAFNSGNTAKAKDCLLALTNYYQQHGQTALAQQRYNTFLQELDSLIHRDSSLVDARLFDITESKIKDLEKEKALQLALIRNKNTLNYILLFSIIAMALLLLLILRSLRAIKTKNKKIALQSLRREMNPHFIFNSLNSVNQFIAENDEVAANKYLTSYSSLMRNVMEHSHKDFVTLAAETEQLQRYLELEQRRFSDKFEYQLHVDEALDVDAVMIPNMLIQPHLENAVWHGLRYKDAKGMLRVDIRSMDNAIRVVITDDGIGLTRSQALKTSHQKAHQSRGITNTQERINLLNDIYHLHIRQEMQEITQDVGTGTKVVLQLPLMAKHDLNRKDNIGNR